MRTIVKTLISIVMTSILTLAAPVDQETARTVASNWYAFWNVDKTQPMNIDNSIVMAYKGHTSLYVFSFSVGGFVIVSANDAISPVLGYSFDSKFDESNLPPALVTLLESYQNAISSATERKAENTTRRALWTQILSNSFGVFGPNSFVQPLLTTRWGQNFPYNELCPLNANNQHCVTGCVATAMAQVMKYWNYPRQGFGQHCYEWETQTLCANFGATTYDWALMPDMPTTSNLAVATLNYHCGVSVSMCYGCVSGMSGASFGNVVDALINCFSYSPSVQFVQKGNYDDFAWKEILKSELNHGRPLAYAGSDPVAGWGHAYVCDGFQAGDYFHFNWGWDGLDNGFFLLDSMTYRDTQCAIVGIEPNPFSQNPWTSQVSGTNANLESVCFVDAMNGWAAGWDGTIIRTTNGGTNWTIQRSVRGEFLQDLAFVGSSKGWAVGWGGIILKTTNGGSNWSTTRIGDTGFRSLFFLNENIGWIVGENVFLKTINGGVTWSSHTLQNVMMGASDCQFVDADVGWIVTYDGLILSTTDGGSNWVLQHNTNYVSLNSIRFVNRMVGWAAGWDGIVLHTTNGGQIWTRVSIGTDRVIYDLDFVDDRFGKILSGAGNTIASTEDGGNRWLPEASRTLETLNSVCLINRTKGFAVGTKGTVLCYSVSGIEVLANGGFENGLTFWQSCGCASPVLVSGCNSPTAAKVNITGKNCNAQFYQRGFVIERGKRYRVSFKAWSSHGQDMQLTVLPHNASTPNIGLDRRVDLSTTPCASYSFDFLATGSTNDARLRFFFNYMSAAGYSYFFDDVTITKLILPKDGEESVAALPTSFALEQNFPNPFNPTTRISFSIPNDGNVSLKVFDLLGREVATLVNETRVAGSYTETFDASRLSSGTYFYRLESGSFVQTKKMSIIK